MTACTKRMIEHDKVLMLAEDYPHTNCDAGRLGEVSMDHEGLSGVVGMIAAGNVRLRVHLCVLAAVTPVA